MKEFSLSDMTRRSCARNCLVVAKEFSAMKAANHEDADTIALDCFLFLLEDLDKGRDEVTDGVFRSFVSTSADAISQYLGIVDPKEGA